MPAECHTAGAEMVDRAVARRCCEVGACPRQRNTLRFADAREACAVAHEEQAVLAGYVVQIKIHVNEVT